MIFLTLLLKQQLEKNIIKTLVIKIKYENLDPGKNNQIKNKKRSKTTIKPSTLTGDEQCFYNSQLKPVGASISDAVVRITAYEYFDKNDIDHLVRKNCRTYASINGKQNFVIFFAYLFMQPLSMFLLCT